MIDTKFTLRKLEMIEAVVRHGSMRAAAEASAVSQPALTQMIKSVEVGLGVELFLRSPRGLEPTHYVQPLIRYLQEIRREIEEAKQELRQFRLIRSDLPL